MHIMCETGGPMFVETDSDRRESHAFVIKITGQETLYRLMSF